MFCFIFYSLYFLYCSGGFYTGYGTVGAVSGDGQYYVIYGSGGAGVEYGVADLTPGIVILADLA